MLSTQEALALGKPGMMVHACDSQHLGVGGRRIRRLRSFRAIWQVQGQPKDRDSKQRNQESAEFQVPVITVILKNALLTLNVPWNFPAPYPKGSYYILLGPWPL